MATADKARASRKAIPAAMLYAMLQREFESARDPRCRSCKVPLPIYREPPDSDCANWHTGVIGRCVFGCHVVLGEVQARLWTQFDLLH